MNRCYSILFAIALSTLVFWQSVNAQVTVSGSSGSANGSYPTLYAAFTALNSVTTQAGNNIVITLSASTTETSSAILNQPSISGWASLTIYPTATGVSISGNISGGRIINLNGADNVTIDGRVDTTGAKKDLVITNTSSGSSAGTSAIEFSNSAENNTIKYCTVKSSTPATATGILKFTTSSSGNGNDHNTIDNCDITSDAGRVAFAIYSYGSPGFENSENTISNNNIYNFANLASATCAININSYSTAWTISGNSIYDTTSLSPTGSGPIYSIYLNADENYSINGNFIGGRAPQCGGKPWTKTNSNNNT